MEKFDEKFYMGMLDDALTVGLPIISTDTAARLMAITYVYGGGNETLILSPKFQCDCKYIQKRFGIQGGEIPDAGFAFTLRSYVKELEKYVGKNFIIRTYSYKGSKEKKLVHTLLVDSALNREGLNELSLHFRVPMHGEAYQRYVRFDDHKPMSVQPLIARRKIDLAQMDSITKVTLTQIAKWDCFRLSRLSPNGYSIRKRATERSPWIGTIEGTRSNGLVTVGDNSSFSSFRLKDFWQSYPSTIVVDKMRSDTAIVTISLYSPEAEPFSFEHYDTVAHSLESAYEDVQPGMSTA